jgi:hypothetical protein
MRSSDDSRPVNGAPPAAARARRSVITVTGWRPQLRLVGTWLVRAGFDIGTWAQVHASAGRIVIEVRGHMADPGAKQERQRVRKALRS